MACNTCKGTGKIVLFTSVEDCPDCRDFTLKSGVPEFFFGNATELLQTLKPDRFLEAKIIRPRIWEQIGIVKDHHDRDQLLQNTLEGYNMTSMDCDPIYNNDGEFLHFEYRITYTRIDGTGEKHETQRDF